MTEPQKKERPLDTTEQPFKKQLSAQAPKAYAYFTPAGGKMQAPELAHAAGRTAGPAARLFLTRCATGSGKDPGTTGEPKATAEATTTPEPEPPQPYRLHIQGRRRLPGKHGRA